MNLATVMQQLADRLDLIPDLNCYGWPPDAVTVPAAIVDYPETYTFDTTYDRGSDEMTVPVYLAVGKVSDRSARDSLGRYMDGNGPASVKQVIEGGNGSYTAFEVAHVRQVADVAVITVGAVDYLAARFTVDITGKGAA